MGGMKFKNPVSNATIVWQADAEVAEAQARAALQAERDRERTRMEESDEFEDEAALAKQRRWDDWKDEHPFGEGNSKLRPTA